MKLATFALIAATVAIPAAAFADSSQPNSSPNAATPAAQTHSSGKAMNSGAKAEDSSIPGASIHESKQDAKMKKGAMTTGAKAGMGHAQEPAGDSSLPGGASKR